MNPAPGPVGPRGCACLIWQCQSGHQPAHLPEKFSVPMLVPSNRWVHRLRPTFHLARSGTSSKHQQRIGPLAAAWPEHYHDCRGWSAALDRLPRMTTSLDNAVRLASVHPCRINDMCKSGLAKL